jgi:CRISPR/Cas system CMR-associated protein Cmr5 small subunit
MQNDVPTMQTADQKMAQKAWKALQKQTKGAVSTDLANAIKKAAIRVRTSGLGVTVAFAQAKKDDHLTVAGLLAECLDLKTPEELSVAYRTQSFPRIRFLTAQAELALEWLAKFADAQKKKV